jgi:hypothetical protein
MRLRDWCVCAFLLLAGCGGGFDRAAFENTGPALVPEQYLVGKTRVYGVFQDRFGTIRRQFVADLDGRWDGEVLNLDERFRYADGALDQRTWQLRKVGEGRYEGTAGDVVGVAKGEAVGQAFHLEYDVVLGGEGGWQVHFSDLLLLQPDNVIINRAIVSKLGVQVGELIAFFRKPEAGATP